jgi:hypothetical protein
LGPAYGLAIGTLLGTVFDAGAYSQPDRVSPVTVNVTLEVRLLSVELASEHVPAALVTQLAAAVPDDQLPATVTPASGPAASRTETSTRAVQLFFAAVALPDRPLSHMAAEAGAVTVTEPDVEAVAPSSSITVSVTG